MRKDDNMVSLNPEYGIEVVALGQIADKVKDDNPELYTILTILIASMLGDDEKNLLGYCNRYLDERMYSDKLKDQISKMLNEYKSPPTDDNINPSDEWDF